MYLESAICWAEGKGIGQVFSFALPLLGSMCSCNQRTCESFDRTVPSLWCLKVHLTSHGSKVVSY